MEARQAPGKPTVFLNTPFAEEEPMFSPDGRWIAYTSTESGQQEVYMRPFPGPGGKWQISTNGGNTPTWSRARRELFYATRDQRIMRVSFSVEGDSFHAEKPQAAATPGFVQRARGISLMPRSFDLHPDGERFAMAATSNADAEHKQDKVVFIFNFFDELRRIAPPAKR